MEARAAGELAARICWQREAKTAVCAGGGAVAVRTYKNNTGLRRCAGGYMFVKVALDATQVYAPEAVRLVMERFLAGVDCAKGELILGSRGAVCTAQFYEDGQVELKSKNNRITYLFLASLISYKSVEWEKLSIFLDLLTPKLPASKEEDLAKCIVEVCGMDIYRVEKKAAHKIAHADKDAEIEPVPTDVGGRNAEAEHYRLSNSLKGFGEQSGATFTDSDRIFRHNIDDVAQGGAAYPAVRNAMANTAHAARFAHDAALGNAAQGSLKDFT